MGRVCSINTFNKFAVSMAIVLAVLVPMTLETITFKEIGDPSLDENCKLTIDCTRPLFAKSAEMFGFEYCHEQKQRQDCVYYYAQKCLPPSLWSMHFTQYNISVKTVEEMCTKTGIYNDDSIKHYNCVNSIEAQNDKCTSLLGTIKGHRNQAIIIERGQCESYKMYIECVHSVVKYSCGREIASFTRHVLNRLALLLSDICDEVQENDNEKVIDTILSPPTDSYVYDDEPVEKNDDDSHTLLYVMLSAIVIIPAIIAVFYISATGKWKIKELRDFDYMKVVV